MLLGYARVSTDDQNLGLQRDALEAAGCEKTFKDMASGAKADRIGLAAMMTALRAGDTVVSISLNNSNSAGALRSMRCHVPALGARHSSLESRSQAYFGYNAGARKVSMADVILAFSCSLPASCISLWREPSMRTTQVP